MIQLIRLHSMHCPQSQCSVSHIDDLKLNAALSSWKNAELSISKAPRCHCPANNSCIKERQQIGVEPLFTRVGQTMRRARVYF